MLSKLTFLVILITFTLFANVQSSVDSKKLLELANTEPDGLLSKSGLEKIIALNQKDKNTSNALFKLGKYYYTSGDYTEAEKTFKKVLESALSTFRPTELFYWIGLSALANNNFGTAVTFFNKIKDDNPIDYICAQIELGFIASKDKRYAEANRNLNNALAFGDNTMRSTAYYFLYKNYKVVNDSKNCDYYASKLISEFPSSLEAEKLNREHKSLLTSNGSTATQNLKSIAQFTIQAGAFSIKENADRLKERLLVNTSGVEIVEVKRGTSTIYLIWVGSFRDKESAELFVAKNLKEYLKSYTVRKREL